VGLYESDHPDIPGMRGLHLFHFTLSNCSQRVRLALEDKGLPWTSHHLNLPANEHLTSDYQRIHPNGVVPALVHDGQVVIESNDILTYLDETFPDPPLRPAAGPERAAMDARIRESSEFQPTIKVLSHELLFRPFRKVGDEEIALFAEKHPDATLVEFLRDYAENGPGWRARVQEARKRLDATLLGLDAALADASWLTGSIYGLADISWVVNANRLQQAQIDLSPWPRLRDWATRAMARPAFQRAVSAYTPA